MFMHVEFFPYSTNHVICGIVVAAAFVVSLNSMMYLLIIETK